MGRYRAYARELVAYAVDGDERVYDRGGERVEVCAGADAAGEAIARARAWAAANPCRAEGERFGPGTVAYHDVDVEEFGRGGGGEDELLGTVAR